MADDTILNPGAGGDVTRSIDKGGVKTTIVTLDVGGAGAESLVAGTVPVSGTVAITSATLATSAKQDTLLAELQLKADLTETQPVSLASLPAVSGSVTANAGTNLNTSLLALEAGGNLASIAAEDFATQATLALIKTKTDNLDTALSGIKTGTDKIISTPATEAKQDTGNTSLDTIATNTGLTSTAANQTTELATLASILANLLLLLPAQESSSVSTVGPMVQGVVSDSPRSYLIDTLEPLSLTPEGLLRVVARPADDERLWQSVLMDDPWTQDSAAWGGVPSFA